MGNGQKETSETLPVLVVVHFCLGRWVDWSVGAGSCRELECATKLKWHVLSAMHIHSRLMQPCSGSHNIFAFWDSHVVTGRSQSFTSATFRATTWPKQVVDCTLGPDQSRLAVIRVSHTVCNPAFYECERTWIFFIITWQRTSNYNWNCARLYN